MVAVALLLLPALAVRQLALDFRWIAGYLAAMSVLTFVVYALDKKRAENREWRVPESQLHLMEFLGGWPGAWMAQRYLRHKCSKRNYQLVFWLIVFAHQFAALDSIQDWKFTRAGLKWFQEAPARR